MRKGNNGEKTAMDYDEGTRKFLGNKQEEHLIQARDPMIGEVEFKSRD